MSEMSCGGQQGKRQTKGTKLSATSGRKPLCETILGVDPGLSVTGYAVIRSNGGALKLIEAGVIVSSPKKPLHERLGELFNGMVEVLNEHSPDVAVLECLFCKRRCERSALMLGHARGAICAVMASHGLPVAEYTFASVKRTIVGKGNATKEQLHEALRRLIGIGEFESKRLCDHAMDALALAVCYALSRSIEFREMGEPQVGRIFNLRCVAPGKGATMKLRHKSMHALCRKFD